MKHIKKIVSIFCVLFLVNGVFAATGEVVTNSGSTSSSSSVLPSEPKLVSKTSNSVILEWDKISLATAYIVKYSEISVAQSKDPNTQYEDETDPVTQTGTEIKNLKPDTTYYFSVVFIDAQGNESDTYSDELSVKTDVLSTVATSTGSSLTIVNISVVDDKDISAEFNNALSNDPIQVKITKTSDNSDVPVVSVTKDITSENKISVKISSVFDVSSSYSLTVISAKDINGNNIQEGINGIKEFTTLEVIPPSAETLSVANSAPATITSTLSGSTAADLVKPATGTKENLLIFVALLVSFAIIYGYRKRFVK